MFGKRKLYPNEKSDNLYALILFLIMIILMLTGALLNLKFFLLLPFIPTLMMVPYAIRQSKQFKKIGQLKDLLAVSVEELQKISGASQYDLPEWKKGKIFINKTQLYQLEYVLECMFEQEYGRTYDDYKKSLDRAF